MTSSAIFGQLARSAESLKPYQAFANSRYLAIGREFQTYCARFHRGSTGLEAALALARLLSSTKALSLGGLGLAQNTVGAKVGKM